MQNKSPSEFFVQRTDRLHAHLGITLTQLPAYLGISEAMFFGYRSGAYAVSKKALMKLDAAEIRAGLRVAPSESGGKHLVKPHSGSYPSFAGNELNALEDGPATRVRGIVKINTPFGPGAGTPTPEDCLNYLSNFLKEAENVPGLVGHTWIQLQRHFRTEDIAQYRQGDPVEKSGS